VKKFIILLSFLFLFSCSDQQKAQLEKKYIEDLHNWISKSSHDPNKVREEVLKTCSSLTMLTATKIEKFTFSTRISLDEYDFRAGFCMKAVVHHVWPQPEFEKKKSKEKFCREKTPFIKKICSEFL
jgi:hypothetical protein